MKYSVLVVIATLLLMGCNDSKNSDYTSVKILPDAQTHPGKKLMEVNCYVCHSPTASHDDRIGPPMIAIKKHYIDDTTTKEEFINVMQQWIKNPTEENAIMYGAVKRFGVMPKTPYPEETIEQIADYMFDHAIEQPEWFDEHFNEQKGKNKGNGKGKGNGMMNGKGNGMQKQQAQADFEELPYGERGLKYALETKAVLGKNLIGTIQQKGTLEALTFCNEKAYPLTDSMSIVNNATIRRVSDKPRNPKNQANTEELAYIKTFKQVVESSKEPKPIVKELDKKVSVYYPITTNTICLQCHGKPNSQIKPKTLQSIAQLYPNDKAIGYDANEMRGLWAITFIR